MTTGYAGYFVETGKDFVETDRKFLRKWDVERVGEFIEEKWHTRDLYKQGYYFVIADQKLWYRDLMGSLHEYPFSGSLTLSCCKQSSNGLYGLYVTMLHTTWTKGKLRLLQEWEALPTIAQMSADDAYAQELIDQAKEHEVELPWYKRLWAWYKGICRSEYD